MEEKRQPNPLEQDAQYSRRIIAIYLSSIFVIVGIAGYAARTRMFQSIRTFRKWAPAVAVNQKIFVFGGQTENSVLCKTIFQFDLEKKTLKHVADFPSGRFAASGVYANGKIYILGGYDGKRYSDEIFRFHPLTHELRVVGNLPEPRAFGGAVSISNRIYYLGGWNGERRVTEILRFNPKDGTSTVTGHIPHPAEYFAAVAHSDKIYILGGENAHGDYIDTVFELAPDSGTVLRQAILPSARSNPSAAVLNHKLYVLGGWKGTNLDDLLEIDPSKEDLTIKLVGHFQGGQAGMGVAAALNSLYLIGEKEQAMERQIALFRIDPSTAKQIYIPTKRYLWW